MINPIYKKVINIINFVGILCFILMFSYFVFEVVNEFKNNTSQKAQNNTYILSWPGILPDNKLYKLKVLRNKIIEKMIINPVKKVEFDLLMADKTIYASQLLMGKGEIELAKETALKGENYYSILVQDYNKALLAGYKIPFSLDKNITLSVIKHQQVFKELEEAARGEEDKKTFRIVNDFSKINYDFIVGLRNSKKNIK